MRRRGTPGTDRPHGDQQLVDLSMAGTAHCVSVGWPMNGRPYSPHGDFDFNPHRSFASFPQPKTCSASTNSVPLTFMLGFTSHERCRQSASRAFSLQLSEFDP